RYRPSGENVTRGTNPRLVNVCISLPDRISQSLTIPSWVAEAIIRRPAGSSTTPQWYPLCPSNDRTASVSRSQRWIFVSEPAQTNFLPSGKKARDPKVTLAPQPLGPFRIGLPVAVFQSVIGCSFPSFPLTSLPVAKTLPSGERAIALLKASGESSKMR